MRDDELWQKAVDFHGHECMGLALGYQAARAALAVLGSERDVDEELVAVVENDSCAVDAIQAITGCTLGKGNLIFRDFGKHAYIFALRGQGRAVRVTVKWPGESGGNLLRLRQKIARGMATEQEKQEFKEKSAATLAAFLDRLPEEACLVSEVAVEIPEKARVFPSVTCSACGEQVMEPRARVKDGQTVCLPCAGSYTRGW